MRLLPIRKISRQSKRLALFLTFCAGYVDAYTFIIRGNTLVAGQTGNVVSFPLVSFKTMFQMPVQGNDLDFLYGRCFPLDSL